MISWHLTPSDMETPSLPPLYYFWPCVRFCPILRPLDRSPSPPLFWSSSALLFFCMDLLSGKSFLNPAGALSRGCPSPLSSPHAPVFIPFNDIPIICFLLGRHECPLLCLSSRRNPPLFFFIFLFFSGSVSRFIPISVLHTPLLQCYRLLSQGF